MGGPCITSLLLPLLPPPKKKTQRQRTYTLRSTPAHIHKQFLCLLPSNSYLVMIPGGKILLSVFLPLLYSLCLQKPKPYSHLINLNSGAKDALGRQRKAQA